MSIHESVLSAGKAEKRCEGVQGALQQLPTLPQPRRLQRSILSARGPKGKARSDSDTLFLLQAAKR
jgi:hypothetical protein